MRWPNSCSNACRRRAVSISLVALVYLTGADGKRVIVNTSEATYFREPREGDHFVKGAHCLIFLSDGRFVSVVETCEAVDQKFQEAK